MKVALVALPWSVLHRPSAAIAAIGAYLRQQEPAWTVQCIYEYARFAPVVGEELYEFLAEAGHSIGEQAFIPQVHPERRDEAIVALTRQVTELVRGFVAAHPRPPWLPDPEDPAAVRLAVENLLAALERGIEATAERTAGFDVVGLTTCFGQLWANLAYARAVKRHNPDVTVVLGGSTVSSAVGPSVLRQYPFVDFVVQGEGELPFTALVRAVAQNDLILADATKGVVSPRTAEALAKGAELWEVPDMNALPVPRYDEYVDEVESLGMPLDWFIPFEGSRGCWWDRINRTGNARDTCYFCNLNLQWRGYREKSIARVVSEMVELSERYANSRIFFLDNIIRHKGVTELADAIEAAGGDFEFFHEMRANVTPLEWVRLKDVGLDMVQVGIEGLSSAYLKRIGKGTTAIQNLQAMRYLRELDIAHFGNLIVDFPGATQEEVDETFRILTNYAICYDPLNSCKFALGRDSTVFRIAEEFPIANVRNRQIFADLLPAEANATLKLFDLSFDFTGTPADWGRVKDFCDRFRRDRPSAVLRKPYLSYRQGDSFIRLYDRRGQLADMYKSVGLTDHLVASLPWARTLVMQGDRARMYTYCMKTRTIQELCEKFPHLPESAVLAIVDEWHAEHLAFREGKRVLALAVAESPRVARLRVLAHEREDEQRRQAPKATRGRALPVVTEPA